MKERPILFSAEMVRAILDGQKTMTRRVVKPQPPSDVTDVIALNGTFVSAYPNRTAIRSHQWTGRSPFGRPGDRLWVRETFAVETCREVGWYDPPFCDGRPLRVIDDARQGRWWEQPHYRATDPAPQLDVGTGEPGVRWMPSIYMPRWASRMLLEVTEVRVERAQEISASDVAAEGGPTRAHPDIDAISRRFGYPDFSRSWFAQLWDHLNAARGFGWDVNPWVWVIGFRRVE